MTEQPKGVADVMGRGTSGPVDIDPADPRTWFLAQLDDRKSWIGFGGAAVDHQLWLSKAPPEKILTNADNVVKLASAVAAYYGLTSVQPTLDTYNAEAEALGQKMIYGSESFPTIDYREPFITSHNDLGRLKAPQDWLSRGRVKLLWDIHKKATAVGNGYAMYCSPFSLAVQLRSYPLLVRDMRRNPAFVHELLSCLTDDILPSYLKAQKEYTGIGLSMGSAAWQSFPNLTTDMIEAFSLPYDLKLLRNCMAFGMMAVQIGGADYCEEDPDKFDKDTLFKCFDIQIKMAGGRPSLFLLMGRTQDIPIEWIVEYLDPFKEKGVRVPMTVGINARVMRDGPPELIIEVLKRYIKHIAPDHQLGIGGLMPSNTPPEHMHAGVAAARAYGRVPFPEDFDEIQVVIPQRESFQEYVDRMSNGMGLQF